MSKPFESDFADRIRHWRTHQAGSLMLNFLPFPLVIYSSISSAVIRPSLSNILPLSSQDRKNQSHIYIVKWKKESCISYTTKTGIYIMQDEEAFTWIGLNRWMVCINDFDRCNVLRCLWWPCCLAAGSAVMLYLSLFWPVSHFWISAFRYLGLSVKELTD